MKTRYIDLMEKTLSAYSVEHITKYLDKVKREGLTEHGFPRLTANMGVLISHGRRRELLSLFKEMMELCCDMLLRVGVKAANEFSVREIVCCIKALESSGAVEKELLLSWKKKISLIKAPECYDVVVESENDIITNWAIFGAVSEFSRLSFGMGGDLDFVERQLSCQFQWIDENSMYCDYPKTREHQPIVYDIVSRGLFAILLSFGYDGVYRDRLDRILESSAPYTLMMQSPNGEIAFGGRSNQFLHNEPWLMVLFEYEARRYLKRGDIKRAGEYKAAVERALRVTGDWLAKEPIRHIKNRFPTETKYGCEKYAYFDKYMITTASFLYAAFLVCDDSLPSAYREDLAPTAFATSDRFHKVFLKSGGYMAELDLNADKRYDACGLGRVHRQDAPSALCLSCPCPAEPVYTVDIPEPKAFSLSSAAMGDKGEWILGFDKPLELKELKTDSDSAFASFDHSLSEGLSIFEGYRVNREGVTIKIRGKGKIGYTLPALSFDGERESEISADESTLSVIYCGRTVRYTTDGSISELGGLCANRNGHYRRFIAKGEDSLWVRIEIL